VDYPIRITRASPFDDVPASDPPRADDDGGDRVAAVTHAVGGSNSGLAIAAPKVAPVCGFKWFGLFVGNVGSQSLTNAKAEAKTAVDGTPFAFAPGVDEARVGWILRVPYDVTAMKVELLRKDKQAVKLRTPSYGAAELGFLTEGSKTGPLPFPLTGSIGFDYLCALDDPAFPGGVPTVEHSPYMLKVTLEGKEGKGYPLVAWTYFHVLVEKLELSWVEDPRAFIPLAKEERRKHLDVYKKLTDPKTVEGLDGKLPKPQETKRVYLSNDVAMRGDADLTGAENPYFTALHQAWGDGPMIPLQVKALVRSAEGKAVFAPLALGKGKFLWDWVDPKMSILPEYEIPEKFRKKATDQEIFRARHAAVTQFMSEVTCYEMEESDDAPEGWNCHVDHGGKRGPGAAPVFPPQEGVEPADALADPGDGAAAFPYKVTQCQTRAWSAWSEAWGKGALAGTSGVIFSPSRMAGDAYRLNVYFVAGTDDEAVEGAKDPESYPRALLVESGAFEVWHEVEVLKYIVIGQPKALDLEKVQRDLAAAFMRLDFDASKRVDGSKKMREAIARMCNGDLRARLPLYVRCAMPTTPPASDSENILEFVRYSEFRKAFVAEAGGEELAFTLAKRIENPKTLNGEEKFDWITRGGKQPINRAWPIDHTNEVTEDLQGEVVVELQDHFGRTHTHRVTFEPDKRVIRAKNLEVSLEDKVALANLYYKCHEDPKTNLQVDYDPDTHRPLVATLKGKTTKEGNETRLKNIRKTLDDIVIELNYGYNDADRGTGCYPSLQGEGAAKFVGGEPKRNADAYKKSAGYEWPWVAYQLAVETEYPSSSAGIYIVHFGAMSYSNFKGPKGKAMYAFAEGKRTIICLNTESVFPTFEHELGHVKCLNHTYTSQAASDPLELHQGTTIMSGEVEVPVAAACTMKAMNCTDFEYFCGLCLLRLRGWSIYKVTDPKTGTFDKTYRMLSKTGKRGNIPAKKFNDKGEEIVG
jgi:hypothetical protein